MHHLSTCGVHTHLPSGGEFPETLIKFPGIGDQDWEEWINGLIKAGPEFIDKEQPKIMQATGFPNTYSLTKNLAEKYLERNRRPDLRVTVSRPAIVTASEKYPFPGWTDSVAAAGAIVYMQGRAILDGMICYPGNLTTNVPVDHCINAILVQTAYSVIVDEPKFSLCQVSPSPSAIK